MYSRTGYRFKIKDNKNRDVFHIFYYQEINQYKTIHALLYFMHPPHQTHIYSLDSSFMSYIVLVLFKIHRPRLINVKNLWEGGIHNQCDTFW